MASQYKKGDVVVTRSESLYGHTPRVYRVTKVYATGEGKGYDFLAVQVYQGCEMAFFDSEVMAYETVSSELKANIEKEAAFMIAVAKKNASKYARSVFSK